MYLQDFYRCEPGQEARALMLARQVCKKKVTDLVYEGRIQAVIDYNATIGVKVTKEAARTMKLEPQQYMKVKIDYYNRGVSRD